MVNTNKQLGLRIKRLREARGQTQNDLAAESGISLKHLGEMERGRGNPSLKSIQRLASSLNVTLAELFNFDVEDKSEDILRSEIYQRLKTTKLDVLKLIHRALTP